MTTAQLPLESKVHRLEVQNHWMVAIIAIVLVALVALIAWAAVPRITTPDGTRTADDLAALWTSHRAENVGTLYAEDATITDTEGMSATGLPAIGDWLAMSAAVGLKAERTGPVIQQGDTVVVPVTLSWYGRMEGETKDSLHQQEVLTILQLDDQGQIVSHRDYGAAPVAMP